MQALRQFNRLAFDFVVLGCCCAIRLQFKLLTFKTAVNICVVGSGKTLSVRVAKTGRFIGRLECIEGLRFSSTGLLGQSYRLSVWTALLASD
jgi:hypothetical protein